MKHLHQVLKSISDQVWALNVLVKGSNDVDFPAWGRSFTAFQSSGPYKEFDGDLRSILWESYLKTILLDPNKDGREYSTEIAGRVTDLVCDILLAPGKAEDKSSFPYLIQPETVFHLIGRASRDAAAAEKKNVSEPSPEKTLLEEFKDVAQKVEDLRQEVKDSQPSVVSSFVVGLGAIVVCLLGGAAAAWASSRSDQKKH